MISLTGQLPRIKQTFQVRKYLYIYSLQLSIKNPNEIFIKFKENEKHFIKSIEKSNENNIEIKTQRKKNKTYENPSKIYQNYMKILSKT